MYGAHVARDHAPLHQRGQCIGADGILGVTKIEGVHIGLLKAAQVVLDALAHHADDTLALHRPRHRMEGAGCRTEQALAARIRRKQADLMAERLQPLGQLQGMHHAAARIDGVGQHGDAQRCA